MDVATEDGLIVRISFSNLFKEFKSTSTWLQFPFVSTPAPGSVAAVTSASIPAEGLSKFFQYYVVHHIVHRVYSAQSFSFLAHCFSSH